MFYELIWIASERTGWYPKIVIRQRGLDGGIGPLLGEGNNVQTFESVQQAVEFLRTFDTSRYVDISQAWRG